MKEIFVKYEGTRIFVASSMVGLQAPDPVSRVAKSYLIL
jgi:hypothetical protein